MLRLSRNEIASMLQFRGADQEQLFSMARQLRNEHCGNRAVVRGVIEITNACVVNCDYCPMRSGNKIDRYFLSEEAILDICKDIRDLGVNVVFLQAGEVPGTTKLVSSLIPKIRKLFEDKVEILLCLGNKPFEEYERFKQLGADSYILKFETSNRNLYQSLKSEDFADRLDCLRSLKTIGYNVGTGFMANIPGQNFDDLVEDIVFSANAETAMISVSPFIPAEGTPLQASAAADFDLTLNALAILRILRPDTLIPSVSAFEQIRPDGQYLGFMAGANVITINFSPESKKSNYLIYGKGRFVVKSNHAMEVLKRANLKADLAITQ